MTKRVCEPAGMGDTSFLRSDELPGRTAVGYLDSDGPRSNIFHLPVRGSGDGGIHTTLADVHSLWRSLLAGEIVPKKWVTEMLRPRSQSSEDAERYGLGFWLHASTDAAMLEGMDTGVFFRTVHDPGKAITHTVISNTTDGAWPVTELLEQID
ncbi:MAG: serine hydrolase domain-containing protein [Acidimicrobiia bacterium]